MAASDFSAFLFMVATSSSGADIAFAELPPFRTRGQS
jgi:hypothetical protein